FFQAEDGIRDFHVTGVQTCALPILRYAGNEWTWSVTAGTEVAAGRRTTYRGGVTQPATDNEVRVGDNVILDIHTMSGLYLADLRSEERRVGNEWRARCRPHQSKKRK